MSDLVFVLDVEGQPLMPMAPAHARRLLKRGFAQRVYHHAFPIVQLTTVRERHQTYPITVGIALHQSTAEVHLHLTTSRSSRLLSVLIDIRTDLPRRLRRRAGHRHRRKARQRYHAPRTRFRSVIPWRGVPTIYWRAHAIQRVIHAFRRILPLTHWCWIPTSNPRATNHGKRQSFDPRTCFYCGRLVHRVQQDHWIPRSRGGSDGSANRVPSCARCNARKGDDPPAQGVEHASSFPFTQRLRPYRLHTSQVLERLLHSDLPFVTIVSPYFLAATQAGSPESQYPWTWIAKPIARPRKQVFSSRNYPRHTRLGAGFVQRKQGVKKRVTVNHALIIQTAPEWRVIRVDAVGATQGYGDHERRIRRGMLCEGRINQQPVRGIVQAIHSSGRLTIITPRHATRAGIRWQRLIMSPRHYVRIRATTPVIFFPYKGHHDGSS